MRFPPDWAASGRPVTGSDEGRHLVSIAIALINVLAQATDTHPRVVRIVEGAGFDWVAAAIGLAAGAGIALAALGLRRNQTRTEARR
jgi:hypothetical protein